MKKPFNVNDWLPEEKKAAGKPEGQASAGPSATASELANLEKAVAALEASEIDITASYAHWRDIGFALAELGETGRDYFHRVSRKHPSYDPAECDKQFQRCLNSKGSGITLATFYHYLKQAGIELPRNSSSSYPAGRTSAREDNSSTGNRGGGGNVPPKDPQEQGEDDEFPEQEKMPVFPQSIYEKLPYFLQKVTATCDSPEERDIMLLGSLTVLSSSLTNFFGLYDGREVRPNLYLFITAAASAGKGRLSLCRRLVQPIHRSLREEARAMKQQYDADLAEYNSTKDKAAEKPKMPQERMLFIPANSSSTGMFQLLADNQGKGLIFETEGDTLSQVFKADYSNYSDGLRKAWHHETISYYRRTDREYVDIEAPCLSTLLTGTPKQVATLIPSTENGLFSRFLFYYMNFELVWKRVFEKSRSRGITEHYDKLGQEFFDFYKKLQTAGEIEVELTDAQIERFYTYFSRIQLRYFSLFNEEYVATIRRLGLIFFRLVMLLTACRQVYAPVLPKKVQCSDEDYDLVLQLVMVLLSHSTNIYHRLPQDTRQPLRKNIREKFLDALPQLFDRKQYMKIAYDLRINPKTAEKYIGIFVKRGLLFKDRYNEYNFPEGRTAG